MTGVHPIENVILCHDINDIEVNVWFNALNDIHDISFGNQSVDTV